MKGGSPYWKEGTNIQKKCKILIHTLILPQCMSLKRTDALVAMQLLSLLLLYFEQTSLLNTSSSLGPPNSLGPCGKPEDIPHAKVEGSSYKFKDTLSYTCERGYVLVGRTSRTCREDGTWSNAPTCSSK